MVFPSASPSALLFVDPASTIGVMAMRRSAHPAADPAQFRDGGGEGGAVVGRIDPWGRRGLRVRPAPAVVVGGLSVECFGGFEGDLVCFPCR